MFRALTYDEIQDFRNWARINHKPGTLIHNDIHHPVIVLESIIIDEEANVPSVMAYRTDNDTKTG